MKSPTLSLAVLCLLAPLAAHAQQTAVPLPYQYSRTIHGVKQTPPCTASQYVTVSGTALVCQSFPTCPSGQFLTFNGAALSCRAPS